MPIRRNRLLAETIGVYLNREDTHKVSQEKGAETGGTASSPVTNEGIQ